MKNKIIIALIFCVWLFCVAISVPPDEVCISRVTRHYTGNNLVGNWVETTGAAEQLYMVEDYFFFKFIINNVTGAVVARAYLGCVQFL